MCVFRVPEVQDGGDLGNDLGELRDDVTYEDLALQTTKGMTLDCPAKNSWLVVDEEHQAQKNKDCLAAHKLRGSPPAFMHARNAVLAACADSRHPQSLALAGRARDACKRLVQDPACQEAEADLRACVSESRTLPRADESSAEDVSSDEEPQYASTDEDDVHVPVQDGHEAARKARRREQNKLAQKKYAQSAAGKATAKARSDSQKAERAARRC